ncbi:MAG: hypothetical protein JXB07_18640 [Anaerolineae bacterium]|nr:hypothetical protein [Anaerolineae bacterium]
MNQDQYMCAPATTTTHKATWPVFLLIFGLTSWACGSTNTSMINIPATVTALPTASPSLVPTVTPPATPSPIPTPTLNPDIELPDDYLYISGIKARAIEIFAAGQAMGNRANIFSKVGDSITVSDAFLKPFSEGNYDLQDHAYLQPVIDYYLQETARDADSFANTSLAAKGGWSVWHEFDAKSADPTLCLPDETPLVCEYRVARPAVALIMLGTNDVPTMSTGRYEEYMRQIIETSIEMGVIPIVSTLPDYFSEEAKVQAMNAVIVGLTEEYQVPLWDYWGSLAEYPKRGLSIDGIHPSWAAPADFAPNYLYYGMTNRNLTALQALDAVWRLVIEPGWFTPEDADD